MTPESTLRVETPEGVVFAFSLASPLTRALAYAIDVAAIAALTTVLSNTVRIVAIVGADWAGALTVLVSFLVSIAYGILLEWRWHGQTLGKRVMRLRVLDARGLRLEFSQIVVRNLLRAVDVLPAFFLAGGSIALATRKCQRLGDLAAGTIVIREPVVQAVDLEQIAPAQYNSLLAHPHLAARLRNRVSAEVAGVVVKALSLRDSYDPSARIALFGELAGYFRSLVPFPEDAVEGLTDEQYLRGVVCALYAVQPKRHSAPPEALLVGAASPRVPSPRFPA
jgi:uncharacterized RDD family membrane protein YckC